MEATINNRNSVLVEKNDNISMRRLLWAGPLTAVVAAIANVIVRELGVALGTIPPDLFILQEPGVFGSTLVQVLLGAAVFALIARFARRPVHTWRIVAVAALLLSLTNPIMVATGMFPMGVSIGIPTVLTMMAMHIVAAAMAIPMLPALARKSVS